MSYREQNPEAWNEDIERYGYICPECGNMAQFKQYWHIVKDIICDDDTGVIGYCDIEYSNNLHPKIAEVECAECGSEAVVCKKGVVKSGYNHDKHVEYAKDICVK